MTAVTFRGFPPGPSHLYYAARVEPFRVGVRPLPTPPLDSKVVSDAGEVTYELTPRIEYTIFAGDGSARNALVSTTRGSRARARRAA